MIEILITKKECLGWSMNDKTLTILYKINMEGYAMCQIDMDMTQDKLGCWISKGWKTMVYKWEKMN